jgi:hypothetical protein
MSIPVERVVGAKGNGMTVGQQVGEAALHHPTCVEIVHIQKRGQNDSENIRAGEFLGQGFDHKLVNLTP